MKATRGAWWTRLALSCLLAAGCAEAPKDKPRAAGGATSAVAATPAGQEDDAEIKANLAKLSPEDRKLAEEQKFCVIEDENRLGTMGPPVKVMVKDQPVFVCCKNCVKAAQRDPDKTLAKVEELKKKAADERAK